MPANGSGSGTNFLNTFLNCYSLLTVTISTGFLITSLNNTFSGCTSITSIVLPNNAQNVFSTMANMCTGCIKLQSIVLPTSLSGVSNLGSIFSGCLSLTSVVFPASMNSCSSMSSAFSGCYNLTSVTLPTSMSACINFSNVFQNCFNITSITMPVTTPATVNSYALAFSGCFSLRTLTLPTIQSTSLNNITSMFLYCGSLTTINNLDKLGSLGATPAPSGNTNNYANLITSLSFNCPFIKLDLNGQSATNFNKLNSLRLLNANIGQWSGTSPQINVSYCDLSTAALNILFADIAAQGAVVTRTINITGCTGAAGLTAADRLVLTSKGWTITG
jgi:hypothetical protein